MKVLQVAASDRGGAGIAALRIHRAVRDHSPWESRFLCLNPSTAEGESLPLLQARNLTAQRARMFAGRLLAPARHATWQSANLIPSGLPKKLAAVPGDLIHLHWPNDELLSIGEFARFDRPVVWTVHDCWPVLPTAHYDVEECDHLPRGLRRSLVWRKKREVFPKLAWQIVAPSEWMRGQLDRSGLFAHAELCVVPHPLPELFRPAPREESRRRFGVDANRPLLIFRSAPGNERVKGIDLVRATMESLGGSVFWISYGEGEPGVRAENWRHLGSLDAEELVSLYSAADLLVAPSRFESFGMSVQECLACGAPALVLKGTAPEMFVKNGENGWVAEDSADSCRSAVLAALGSERNDAARENASARICEISAPEKVAAEYAKVYARALERAKEREK